MVDALRKVRWTTVVLFLAALIGCSVGARRFLLQEETFAPGDPVIDAPASGQHAEPLTLEITEAMWAKAAFSPGLGTNTFTAKARVLARHPFVWVLRADVRIQDPSGRTVYTALQIKKVVCKHQPGKGDRMKECSATVDLAWTWNGRDPATGDILPDASYLTQLTVRLLHKRATHTSSVSVDSTPPAIVIEQPTGQISGPSVPVSISWTDVTGVDGTSGVVSLDGIPVTGITVDDGGARGTVENVSVGTHTLAATVSDLPGNEATGAADFELIDEQEPGAQKTMVFGTVTDSSGQPLAGVTASSSAASRSATTDSAGAFAMEMSSGGTHWVTLELPGYVPVQRSADVPEGQHFNMGAVGMARADPLVTTITPDGGTAVDSTGDVELQFPAGALSTATDFRLTVIPSSREIPGPLNSGENIEYPIAYTNCVIFDPGDVALAQPVTMRVRNRWGFPTGYRLPTAFYDMSANKWVPDGLFLTVSADGTMLEKQLTSLGAPGASQQRARSARTSAAADAPSVIGIHDGNASASTSASHDDQKDDPPCPPGQCCDDQGNASASTIGLLSSNFHKELSLPSVSGAPHISFAYSSETASPSLFVNVINSHGTSLSQMQNWLYSVQINGQRKEAVFQPTSAPSRMLYFWDGRNGAADLSPTGLYSYTSTVSARYPAYYAIQESWGGMPTGLSSVPSGELGEKRRVLEEPLPLINRASSPFGAGWSLAGLPQLHVQSDGKILEVNGGAAGTIYYPRINFARVAEGASVISVTPAQGTEGDSANMLGHHGTSLKVSGQIADIDYQDGFGFSRGYATYDSVVIDLGQDRQIDTLGLSFIVPETTQAIVTQPIVRIYTSLDNTNWTLWSKTYLERIEGAMGVGLTSPYLAGHGAAETVRYVRYELLEPSAIGDDARTIIWRLMAFGPSDRYGNGPDGQDENFPRLRKLESGEYEQSERSGTVLRYSAEGLLQSVTDIHGQATTYTWENGLLTAISDFAGGVTSFAYSNGKLSQVTDAAGRTTSLTIDANGDLTGVRMPDGSSAAFGYDTRHLITSQTDPRGNVTTLTWDTTYPRLKKVQKPDGGERTFTTGYFEHLFNGITGDDASPAVPPSMEMSGSLTDEIGRVTTHDWQAFDTTPPYNPQYQVRRTDPIGRVADLYKHPRLQGVEVLRFQPDGSEIRNTYDPDEGRFVLKVEDLTEDSLYRTKAQYTYEPLFKRVATSTDFGGHTTSYVYNDKGDLISTSDPLGNATAMTYDAKGQLLTVTDAEGAVARYEYDPRGSRTKTIDPLGRETVMTYDAAGNMTTLTDAAGKVTRWEYDSMGRVTKVTDPAGGETRYVYEAGPCTSGCGGGASNLLKSITDPAGQTTSFEYNAAGNMTAVVNPLGIRKEYGYDLAGRLTRFKNGRAQEIVYEYDSADRLVRKTLPDEGAVEYAYSTNNQVTQVTDADSILRYEYPSSTGYAGRAFLKGAKSMEYMGSKDDPRYDKQAPGSITFDYSAQIGGTGKIELLGRAEMKTDLTLTQGQSQYNWQSYTYDGGHRLTGIQPYGYWDTTFGYDRVGRRTSMTVNPYGSRLGNSSTYLFDLAGQLQSLTGRLADGTTVGQFVYTYDQAGNRTAMTDLLGSHAFGYDDRYQLTAATHPTQASENFGYDSVGNRTTSHISPSYVYNAANQLLEDSEFTYTFDADGNCTGKVSKIDGTRHEYIFNSENRMTGYRKYDISSTLLTTADCFYDALGRRIAKSVGGALTRYMYNEEDIWLAITPNGTAIHYHHGPGIDEPLVAWTSYDGGYYEPLYYFADGLGSIRAARGQDWLGRDMSATYEFDSFGQVISSTSTLRPDWPLFTYTAREDDSESGLLFYRARHYDPRAGRFTAEDSVKQGNLYPYVDNNPTNWTDPQGTHKLWFIVSYWHTECVDHHRHPSGDQSGTVISCHPPGPPCNKTVRECQKECANACLSQYEEWVIDGISACCGAPGVGGWVIGHVMLADACLQICHKDPCTFGP